MELPAPIAPPMTPSEWTLLIVVFAPFVAAAVALALGRWLGRQSGWLMVIAAGVSFAGAVRLFLGHSAEAPPVYHYDWIPDLGISLRLIGDPFGLFFAMLVAGIGLLVGFYSVHYIDDLPKARVGRYYAALIAFMGAMLGVSLADDLILLFIFWELTSLTSFLLIGFWYEKEDGRKGALTALQVTAVGGLAMLAGFVLVSVAGGTFSISELSGGGEAARALQASPLFSWALVLILLGAFTKSAQWPFHFWLPGAMVAPTPVSTYLHSATMVKAGLFLVGRMWPVFDGAPLWTPLIATIGLVTYVLACWQALIETDLKAILARTTLAALGMVMMLYGLKAPDQDALQLLSHAAYKAPLFLIAGIVEHATHTRDYRKLGGLQSAMPLTFVLCLFAALSMAGLPPMFGFLAKEALYANLLENEVLSGSPALRVLVIGLCVIANAFLFAVSFRLIVDVFLGAPGEKSRDAHEAGPGLWLSPAVLVAVVVGMGVLGVTHLPQTIVNSLSSDAGAHVHVSLIPSLDHPGPLILSGLTIAAGIVVFQMRWVIGAWHERFKFLPTMQRVWDEMLHGVTVFAVAFSERWQNGSLRWYFSGILVFFAGLCAFALSRHGFGFEHFDLSVREATWPGVTLCAMLLAAIWRVTTAPTRLSAAIAITTVGYLVAMLFVVYRSPDILLTQILIETVSTIFLLLVLYFMPAFRPMTIQPARRLVNAVISGAVGLSMFTLVLLATSPTFREADNLADDYLSHALTHGGGYNAVNVTIVDQRGIDTVGEVTVVMAVGLTIVGLLRVRREAA